MNGGVGVRGLTSHEELITHVSHHHRCKNTWVKIASLLLVFLRCGMQWSVNVIDKDYLSLTPNA